MRTQDLHGARLQDDHMVRFPALLEEMTKKIAPRLSNIPAGDHYDMAESLYWVVECFASDELDAAAEEFHLLAGVRLFNRHDGPALKAIGLLMYLDVLAARPHVMQTTVERLRAALRGALLDE